MGESEEPARSWQEQGEDAVEEATPAAGDATGQLSELEERDSDEDAA